jgi:hypothetical protein
MYYLLSTILPFHDLRSTIYDLLYIYIIYIYIYMIIQYHTHIHMYIIYSKHAARRLQASGCPKREQAGHLLPAYAPRRTAIRWASFNIATRATSHGPHRHCRAVRRFFGCQLADCHY